MKPLILRVIVALLTFSAGVGFDRLRTSKPKPVEKTTQIVASEPTSFVPAPLLPVIPTSPTPTIICDYDPLKFEPIATFYVISQKPRTFGDYDLSPIYFEILPTEREGQVNVRISDFGGHETPPTEFALVTDRRFFFVTGQTSDGYEYRFDGEFLRRGILYDAREGKAVLKGTLTKARNGRTVFEWAMKFGIVYDEC